MLFIDIIYFSDFLETIILIDKFFLLNDLSKIIGVKEYFVVFNEEQTRTSRHGKS